MSRPSPDHHPIQQTAACLLAAGLSLTLACSSGGSGGLPPAAAGIGTSLVSSAEAQDAARPAPPAVAGDPVGRAVAHLAGMPAAEQLRTLRWMLTVDDDRRLIGLFADLPGGGPEELPERAVQARQRLERLVATLEQAGVRAEAPAGGRPLAEVEPNAEPPNAYPASLLAELRARAATDPAAAEALAEALRVTSPRVEESLSEPPPP